MTQPQGLISKSLDRPDETRPIPNGKGTVAVVQLGGATVMRATFQPGWRWSEHVKPIAGTEWCEAPHFQYHAAGRLRIQMEDGNEFEAAPGEVTALPSGHDAWVVGEEPVVLIDFFGASTYAK